MYRTYYLLFLLLFCSRIGNAQIIKPPNGRIQSAVSILHVDPEQPVEGMPVIVYFRFTNRTGGNLSGWIGADINSGTGVPGESAVDWQVKDLPNNQSIDGATFVRAPNAGPNRLVRVFFYERTIPLVNDRSIKSPPLYEIGKQDINIAALVSFSLNNFVINHTRARSTDTDYGSLYVTLNGQAVMQPASSFLGNYQDGTFDFTPPETRAAQSMQMVAQTMQSAIRQQPEVNKVYDTGPFAVVPGISSTIKATYFIYNGGSIANSDAFLKGFAEATANPELFNGPRPGRQAWFEAMRVLCPALNIVGACDGFVTADSIMIETNALFDYSGTGNVSFERHFDSEEFASQTGCGNTSNYVVYSNIKRLSNAGSMESFSPIYTSITANRKVNIFDRSPVYPRVNWKRIETISGNGSFIAVPGPEYGTIIGNTYTAPSTVPRPLLVILRGVIPQVSINNSDYDVFANSELRNVTAIIQLIPGQTIRNPGSMIDHRPGKGR